MSASVRPSRPDSPDLHTTSDRDSIAALLERASVGDRAALDELFALYLPALCRWARGCLPRYACGVNDTDDLVQETLVSALRNLHHFQFRHEGAFGAYLHEVLRNEVRHAIRAAHRRPAVESLDQDLPDPGRSPLESAVRIEQHKAYECALAAMPPCDRQLIVGRIDRGMQYEDLAMAVGKPSADAARMASVRAIQRLARSMTHF